MIEPTTSTTSGTTEGAEEAVPQDAGNGQAAEARQQDGDQATRPDGDEQASRSGDPGGDAESVPSGNENGVRDETADEEPGEEDEETDAERVARLEREGDIAADYLEELLDIADVDGDIDLDVEGDRALVSVVGGELKRLTGSDGSVLEALQELTRLAVLRETGYRSRLMLDVGGFRARRRQELERRAESVADQVASSGKPERMDPMTPFERKIVHDTVAAKGLVSESEGEEPNRRVVVEPS